MTTVCSHKTNHYEQNYNKEYPIYPSKKHLQITRLNGFSDSFCLRKRELRISYFKNLTKHLPFIPDEIWSLIMEFQIYLEEMDENDYNSWLYSEYSKKQMKGMKLRNRTLYIPNIYGIIMNEGESIVKCGERALCKDKKKNKIIIENLSSYFLQFIVKWFHWMNNNGCKFYSFIYHLRIKSNYFMRYEHHDKFTNKAYSNFYCAQYYMNIYYPNYTWGLMTYKDFDFETYIFYNDYYRKVYNKAMMLRNYKRINVFLHE